MGEIKAILIGIPMIWLTYRIYRVLASRYRIVSFSGFIGHMWGHLDLLFWSFLGAALIIGIILTIIDSIFGTQLVR